jgi:hypothetical protein
MSLAVEKHCVDGDRVSSHRGGRFASGVEELVQRLRLNRWYGRKWAQASLSLSQSDDPQQPPGRGPYKSPGILCFRSEVGKK